MTVNVANTACRTNRGIVIRVSLRGSGASLPIIAPVNAPLIAAVSDTRHAETLAACCGGSVLVDEFGPQIQLTVPSAEGESVVKGWVAPIADLAVLSVEGDDAVRFLHSQLTNDIEALNEKRWVLAGYCSAKGRLLTSLMCWRTEVGVRLIVPQPFVPGLKKRLAMFVLRAKVRIVDETDRWCLFGLGGTGAADAMKALGSHWPAPNAIDQSGSMVALGCTPIPAAGLTPSDSAASVARALLVVPSPDSGTVWSTLTAQLTAWSSTLWRWADTRAGQPRLAAAGLERFVPQMVNLDLVDGVSFKKGCYPGQEIVARSHYLGKLKRRMFLAHTDGPAPAPGSDVLAPSATEPCGEVVTSAPSPQGGSHLLFESQIALAPQACLADGRLLTLLDLPYPVER